MITVWGETKTMNDWVKDPRCQISQPSLSERLAKGMNPEEAISTPPVKKGRTGMNPVKIGDKFGILEIIDNPRMEAKGKQMASKVKCRCGCGNETDVFVNSLRGTTTSKTVSCGCVKKEKASQRMIAMNEEGKNSHPTHNMSRTRLYRNYYEMLSRCYNENATGYLNYGGRGIAVCDEWKESFPVFAEWALSHGYDDNLTIERKNVNGNYCPENCTFATLKEQANNTRRNSIHTFNGETKTLAQWSEDQRCIVDYNTLRYRILYYGWSFQDSLITPSIRKST